MKYNTFVGLDVHAELISVATIQQSFKDAIYLGQILNEPEAIRKLVQKLGDPKTLIFCYEAGPCGYGIYRQLTEMGAKCIVVAPSLIPHKPGDRVKTDKRDSKKLATLLMHGMLTPVWVPDENQEAIRDLLRAREDAIADLLRKRHQITKFLLRLNLKPPVRMSRWTHIYRRWLESIQLNVLQQITLQEYIRAMDEAQERVKRLEKEITFACERYLDPVLLRALQSLRGVGLITAATLLAELGEITRFANAPQLMSYSGLVPGEQSSGSRRRQGGITKAGNAHIRRVIVEAAHHYRHQPSVGEKLKKRQKDVSPEVISISWNAQNRLNRKYRQMLARGKSKQGTITAIARELLGFIWAIGQQVEIEKNAVA